MTLRLVAVALASFPLLVSGAPQERDPCDAPPRLMRQFGTSYKQALHDAYAQKQRALAVLFQLSTSSELDGLWAECYASDMRKLLAVWGDESFAAVLHKQSPSVRKAESRFLHEQFGDLASRYPESFGVKNP
jgi:hypothetical protein